MKTFTADSAAYYGNLSRVAAQFYITTGAPAELDAAYFYARYAARDAHHVLYQVTCECEECGDRYVADVADSLVFCPECVESLKSC